MENKRKTENSKRLDDWFKRHALTFIRATYLYTFIIGLTLIGIGLSKCFQKPPVSICNIIVVMTGGIAFWFLLIYNLWKDKKTNRLDSLHNFGMYKGEGA
jgi:hypothetical protein